MTNTSASPYRYSTHRIPDERTTIEATPLSATSAELVLGVGPGLGLGSHSAVLRGWRHAGPRIWRLVSPSVIHPSRMVPVLALSTASAYGALD